MKMFTSVLLAVGFSTITLFIFAGVLPVVDEQGHQVVVFIVGLTAACWLIVGVEVHHALCRRAFWRNISRN